MRARQGAAALNRPAAVSRLDTVGDITDILVLTKRPGHRLGIGAVRAVTGVDLGAVARRELDKGVFRNGRALLRRPGAGCARTVVFATGVDKNELDGRRLKRTQQVKQRNGVGIPAQRCRQILFGVGGNDIVGLLEAFAVAAVEDQRRIGIFGDDLQIFELLLDVCLLAICNDNDAVAGHSHTQQLLPDQVGVGRSVADRLPARPAGRPGRVLAFADDKGDDFGIGFGLPRS